MANSPAAETRLLVIADDAALRTQLCDLLACYRPETCADSSAVLPILDARASCRLALLVEGEDDGAAALQSVEAVRDRHPDVAVLVLSRRPTIQHAAEAIRRGAEDFVPVPFSEEVLRKEVDRILEAAELRDRVDTLGHLVRRSYGFDRIISGSPRMRAVFELAQVAARSDTPVLIAGETGTGKELIARAIHANSRRARRAFVPLNCAALPRDLVESELFGHRRGAFSGAIDDHPGLFVAAHGGTLLLDEITELPLEVQAKLLRVLQDGEVRAVGGLESRRVDVRIVACTNQPVAAVRDRGLRQDLFYRLSVLVIDVPPLRERLGDLPLLVDHFLSRLRERGATGVERLEPEALECLAGYGFPGNVRELENLLEGIAVSRAHPRRVISGRDVRAALRSPGHEAAAELADNGLPLKLDELEAWAIREALQRSHGNKRRAAQLLGISRDTLYRRLGEMRPAATAPDSLT